MLFIGICGASGSGKSTLAQELCKTIGANCVILNQDAYYLDHAHLPFEERVKLNYDKPSIFDHDLLLKDIETLLNGFPIEKKDYDYSLHRRADTKEKIYPRDILILEGIHVFYDQRLVEKMYLRLYMNVEPDICLLRRIERDILERGRDIEGISNQYLSTVKPMYDKYIRNYISQADVIVANGGKNARIVDILGGYMKNQLKLKETFI